VFAAFSQKITRCRQRCRCWLRRRSLRYCSFAFVGHYYSSHATQHAAPAFHRPFVDSEPPRLTFTCRWNDTCAGRHHPVRIPTYISGTYSYLYHTIWAYGFLVVSLPRALLVSCMFQQDRTKPQHILWCIEHSLPPFTDKSSRNNAASRTRGGCR